MSLAIRRRGLVRTGAETVVVVILALLAMANPGSPKGDGGPGFVGGFSSGSWDGTTPFDDSYYKFGIIDASVGSFSALCDFSTAVYPHFADAAKTLLNQPGSPAKIHAFWLVMSNYRASLPASQGGCGLSLSPYQWGQQQANNFLYFVALTGYSNTVQQMLGDVEVIGSAVPCTTTEGEYLSTPDRAMWLCDSHANNEEVVEGFEDTLAAGHFNAGYNGVYTGRGAWPQITNEPSASSVGTSNVWMASQCASQQQLSTQAQYFDDLDYDIFSWQYATNDSSIPGCGTCELTYATAGLRARQSPIYIARWDVWTNSHPSIAC